MAPLAAGPSVALLIERESVAVGRVRGSGGRCISGSVLAKSMQNENPRAGTIDEPGSVMQRVPVRAGEPAW